MAKYNVGEYLTEISRRKSHLLATGFEPTTFWLVPYWSAEYPSLQLFQHPFWTQQSELFFALTLYLYCRKCNKGYLFNQPSRSCIIKCNTVLEEDLIPWPSDLHSWLPSVPPLLGHFWLPVLWETITRCWSNFTSDPAPVHPECYSLKVV